MPISSYEKDKAAREARQEAELRRARRGMEALSGLDRGPAAEEPEEPQEEEEAPAEETPEERERGRESRLKRAIKDEAKERMKQYARRKGREFLERRLGKEGAKRAAQVGGRAVGRGMGAAARGLGAGLPGAAPVAGVGVGGIATGGVAVGGTAVGGTAVAGGAVVTAPAWGTVLIIIIAVLLILALLFGIIFYLLVIAPVYACTADKWWTPVVELTSAAAELFGALEQDICYEIRAAVGYQKGATTPTRCDEQQYQEWANWNLTPYPNPQNSPPLVDMMACIQEKVPAVAFLRKYTFDQDHRTCNFTRGTNAICEPDGRCSHKPHSCHYGGSPNLEEPGSPRNQGALAVDYSFAEVLPSKKGGLGNQIIAAARVCGAKAGVGARCEDSGGNTVLCSSASATHVHVTHQACDRQ